MPSKKYIETKTPKEKLELFEAVRTLMKLYREDVSRDAQSDNGIERDLRDQNFAAILHRTILYHGYK